MTARATVADGLGVEEMLQLFIGHACTRILDGDFYIVVCFLSRDEDLSAFGRELTGIVGQGVQHKQCQHTVGLDQCLCGFHLKSDTFHPETLAAFRHHIKEWLQGEGLNLQVQFALAQLDPVGQDVVIVIDLTRQFTDISLITPFVDTVDDTVDERCNTIHERDLGSLL